MTDVSRRSLLAATGAALTAGCLTDLGDGPGGDGTTTTVPRTETPNTETPRTESRERETTDNPGQTTADPDETTTGDWIEHASNQPNSDHDVTLNNESDAAETVQIRVERDETGETVFETTETVDPGVEISVWNLKKANPDGVEAFTVCAELVESAGTTDGAGTRTTTDAETRTASDTERTTTTSEKRDCAPLHTNECYGDAHVTVWEDSSLQIIYAIC